MTDDTQPEAREFTMSQYASKDDMIGAMRKRIAELESELEAVGAGGVQALSAAPVEQEEAAQRLRKTLDIDPGDVNDPLHPRYIAGFKPGHAAGRRRAALAASPTPPAEQQAAPKAAPQPSPAAQGDAIEHELAMLIRRIVSSARRNCEDGSNVLKLANEAWAYLVRKGLNGSPLRDAGIESDPTPPAKAAESVQEDAARLDWLEQNLFHREKDEWDTKYGGYKEYNMWVLFSPKGIQGSARNIIDAAREQGGA